MYYSPKGPIASKSSDKMLSQKDAKASFLSLFLNSVKFSLRSWDNWVAWLLRIISKTKNLKKESKKL